MTIALLIWLIFINTFAWLAFRADKRRAVAGWWRIPEAQLLALSFAGGWLGAKVAQHQFRHKTRKQPFAAALNVVPLLWIGLGGLILAMPSLPQKTWAAPVRAAPASNLQPSRSGFGTKPQPGNHRFFQKAREH